MPYSEVHLEMRFLITLMISKRCFDNSKNLINLLMRDYCRNIRVSQSKQEIVQ
jgi:hypothetical protein